MSFPDYIGKIQNKIQELCIEGEKDSECAGLPGVQPGSVEQEKDGEHLLLLFRSGAACAASGFTSHTLGNAAGLGDLDKTVLETLAGTLYHRSLLEFSADSGRYSMHPLMRQIAEKKLKDIPEEEKRVKKNHCTYFLHYSGAHNEDPQALIREKDGIWLALIQANELENGKEVRERFIDNLSHHYRTLLKDGRYQDAFNYLIELNLINIDEIGEVTTLVPLLDPFIEHLSRLNDFTKGFVFTQEARPIYNLASIGRLSILMKKPWRYTGASAIFAARATLSATWVLPMQTWRVSEGYRTL